MTKGLRFCMVDLHVHTPASKCFRGTITPEAYVEQAIAAGMQAIAITDHNSGDWVDRIKEAAAGTPLTVFPGVEISVQPGVHIVAIFPENRSGAHVNDMLARLQLDADQRGEQAALVTAYGAQKVISMIRDEGALPILAHIDDYKGVWRELSGQTRIQLWNAAEYAAVEIVGDELPDEIGKAPYEHRPAYYWASDNPHPEDTTKHSHLGIGTHCSLFKLDEPITWEGLRLCFHDPAVRIRPYSSDDPITMTHYQHPVIERVCIDGGFLADLDLTLNPNLNCIIGGRGTGKSTFLELVRYAFGINPKTDANRKQAHSLIQHAFPSGSQISVDIITSGTRYRIERPAGKQPRVIRRSDGQQLDVLPAMLLPIQAYGQKEIYEISQDPQFQLHLLDNYLAEEMQPLEAEEQEMLRQLEDNAARILSKKERIEAAEEKLSHLGMVREELRRMQERDFVERLQEKNAFDREKRLLERAEAEVEKILSALENFRQQNRPDEALLADLVENTLPHQSLLAQHKQLLDRIAVELDATLAALPARIREIWAGGRPGRSSWQERFQTQEEAYRALLREFQDADEKLSPDRYMQLQNQLMALEELADATREEQTAVEKLYARRQKLLADLRRIRRQQYELRCQKAEQLTVKLKKDVRITVHPAGNREVYAAYLEDFFRGQRIQAGTREQLAEMEAERPEREAQKPVKIKGETRYLIRRIPAYRDPIDLAAAIRDEWREQDEPSELAGRWQVSSAAMRRNLAGLTEAQLFELETFAVPDLPLIELQVGNGELGYRPLAELSIGQKCTALLGIVLLESPATLLVDQPEDDLDNQFIFDQIVATLRREKERRQFIIATHNANIPVSGDAELIVVVEASEKRGWVPADGVGSIDAVAIKHSVERILEGGQQAFKIRSEKYGRV